MNKTSVSSKNEEEIEKKDDEVEAVVSVPDDEPTLIPATQAPLPAEDNEEEHLSK